jgi:hypothetical protein
MDTRPEMEAKWRGSCFILVIFSSQQIRQKFGQSKLKIYWQDQCYAEGRANSFFNPEDLEQKRDTLLLDLSAIANQYANWPDRLEVTFEDKTIANLEIIFEQKKTVNWPVLAFEENQKGLLI